MNTGAEYNYVRVRPGTGAVPNLLEELGCEFDLVRRKGRNLRSGQ